MAGWSSGDVHPKRSNIPEPMLRESVNHAIESSGFLISAFDKSQMTPAIVLVLDARGLDFGW